MRAGDRATVRAMAGRTDHRRGIRELGRLVLVAAAILGCSKEEPPPPPAGGGWKLVSDPNLPAEVRKEVETRLAEGGMEESCEFRAMAVVQATALGPELERTCSRWQVHRPFPDSAPVDVVRNSTSVWCDDRLAFAVSLETGRVRLVEADGSTRELPAPAEAEAAAARSCAWLR